MRSTSHKPTPDIPAMVGVPRSHGCSLCVKRRVKCDETRPGCSNCAKYGADCPGYNRAAKFVAGKHAIRPRRAPGEQGIPDVNRAIWFDAADASGDRPKAIKTKAADVDLIHLLLPVGDDHGRALRIGSPAEELPILIPAALVDDRAAFVGTMIDTLQRNTPQMEIGIFGPLFASSSAFLGRRVTLDSAMCAFTLHLLAKAKGDQGLVGDSRRLYGQSLAVLQQALVHPTEWRSPETLATVMVLCMYELFADTSGGHASSWIQHAGGISSLIQKRGVKAYTNAWDRMLLFSFRSLIIMFCFFTFQDCFLAKPQWQKIMLNLTADEMNHREEHKRALYVSNQYLACLAKIPNIMRRGVLLREAHKHAMTIDLTMVGELVSMASRVRSDLLKWKDDHAAFLGEPEEVDSTDPISPYAKVLSFANPWLGAMMCGFWTCLLIAQESLNQCEPKEEYSKTNRVYANSIYRSIETVGQGIMGGYRIGFAVRVSYDFADLTIQQWIRAVLERTAKTYSSVTPAVYPPVAPNPYMYN